MNHRGHDERIQTSVDRDRRVLELFEQVVEVEQRLIPTGLHIFGRNSDAAECADVLRMVASFDRPEHGTRALPDLIAENLRLGNYSELLAGNTEEARRSRERVESLAREVIQIFLKDGVASAVDWLSAQAQVPAHESKKLFRLTGDDS